MSNRAGEPDDTPPIFFSIDDAVKRGDIVTATTLARQALGEGHSHPVLFTLRAFWHETEQRYVAACVDLERALLLSPGDAKILVALGRCRAADGRIAGAIEAADQAIAIDPNNAAAYHNKGLALETLGELDEAWSCYARAAELDPTTPDASARLAWLSARRGDRNQARELANGVFAITPGHPLANAAHVLADLADRNFEVAEMRARAMAASPEMPAQSRAQATGFAADALDGQGRFAEAFGLYEESNADMRAIFRERMEGPGAPPRGRQIAQRLAQEFSALPAGGWASPLAAPESEAAGLVFVLGFPRSGTTLLGQILAAHSRTRVIEERPLLAESVELFVHRPNGMARLAGLTAADVADGRTLFWNNVRDFAGDIAGRVVVDQSPLHSMHLPIIAKLFPEAKIVFALRDPRDVVLSCFRQRFVINTHLYEFLSLEGSAAFYDETMRLADRFRHALPLAIADMRNEDLVADFDGETRRLCAFLGLDWEESMRDFAGGARQRRISTPSAIQVARGLNTDGIGRWRGYAKEMAPILPLLAPWVERFGYSPD